MRRIAAKYSEALLNEISYVVRQQIYRKAAVDTSFSWDWDAQRYNRSALVGLLVQKSRQYATRYLEIGCQGNVLFDAVACAHKVGLDPKSGGTHRMTSDRYFAEHPDATFDVIFVDGLHSYGQVRKDAINSLSSVAPGGWIAFHDLLPASWKEHHVPRLNRHWAGDCWKLAVELSQTEGIDFRIISIDRGVGVLRMTSEEVHLVDMTDTLTDAEYDVFCEWLPKLPVITWDEAVDWISTA
ncbi:MAG: class I SAM-dependent methyltransferase [Pseudomonadota bacterium]